MQDIKALRKRLGLSQRQFAERLGVKRRTIIRWESSLNELGLALNASRTPNQEFQRRLSQLEANVTDKNVTDENVTDGNVTDGNVTDSLMDNPYVFP